MSGFAKNGVLYPCNGIYGIKDDAVSSSTGWSSQKIMDKLAHVKSIIRVDARPTLEDGTITYVKDGVTYTTTDTETWFYYIIDDLLYKTIFIDGVEYTKDDSDVILDDYVEKASIVTTLNDTVTDEQIPSAKVVYDGLESKIDADKIATSVSSSSTNEEVVGAKLFYDTNRNKLQYTTLNDGTTFKFRLIFNNCDKSVLNIKIAINIQGVVYDLITCATTGLYGSTTHLTNVNGLNYSSTLESAGDKTFIITITGDISAYSVIEIESFAGVYLEFVSYE